MSTLLNQSKSRRPFVLLELLIALALVALTLFPLLAPSSQIARVEREMSKTLEQTRRADELFGELVVKLYRREIPFSLLAEGGELAPYTFGKPETKKTDEEEIRFLLVPVEITLNNRSYYYAVTVEKKAVE